MTLADPAAGETYHLENGYLRIVGSYGKISEISLDPKGEGEYATKTLRMWLGRADIYNSEVNKNVSWSVDDNKLELYDLQVPNPEPLVQDESDEPMPPLDDGGTYGQSFSISTPWFTRVGISAPTFFDAEAGFTLTLYRGDPGDGLDKVSRARFEGIPDGGWHWLFLEEAQPAGQYYLEMSEGTGTPSWWYLTEEPEVDLGGQLFVDREPREGAMTLSVYGVTTSPATWRLTLEGPRLTSTQISHLGDDTVADLFPTLVTPWERDGYSTEYSDGMVFRRFLGRNGRYFPVHQMKRHAETEILDSDYFVHASGTGPFDLRISSAAVNLAAWMTSDQLSLFLSVPVSGHESGGQVRSVALEALPNEDWLPEFYPVFIASTTPPGYGNSRRDQWGEQLSEFYYERAFSLGYGLGEADWRDWKGRISAWTASPARQADANALLDTGQSDDGYVWSWGDTPGWPFPDPDLYDTHHFTTNPAYVLGTWRSYSWSGDTEFFDTMLPRVRLAIDFLLESLDGSSGLLTIPSPDHTGEIGALGTNYWDLLSHGYKDAYCNAYFYGALQAAAQLEHYAGNRYRVDELTELRRVVKQRFTETFWDDDAGRFIQSVDANGVRRDFGSSYTNIEALAFGLGSPDQVQRIYRWLERGSTELSDFIVNTHDLLSVWQPSEDVPEDGTLGQTFRAHEPFMSVGGKFDLNADRDAAYTLTLYEGGPGGHEIKSGRFAGGWDGAWGALEFDRQPPGDYYLEASVPSGRLAWFSGGAYEDGNPFINGHPSTAVASRTLAAASPYRRGPADIYSRWKFAPRATTRRNPFWYTLSWDGPAAPWESQLQDGGASLYTSGFDILARAQHVGADDAWQRTVEVLDRWSEPDHLCGGKPLYYGETPQHDPPGQVGVDRPFPESAVTPGAFLPAFVGAEATPEALVITPNLPSRLHTVGVRNLYWRGHHLELLVTRREVTVRGDGIDIRKHYRQGESVELRASDYPPPIAMPFGETESFLALDAGVTADHAAAGFIKLGPESAWDRTRGFGWISGSLEAVEGNGSGSLGRNYITGNETAGLRISVPPRDHTLHVLSSDTSSLGDIVISVDGSPISSDDVITLDGLQWRAFPVNGGPTGEIVDFEFSGVDGQAWRLGALVLMPVDEEVVLDMETDSAVLPSAVELKPNTQPAYLTRNVRP